MDRKKLFTTPRLISAVILLILVAAFPLIRNLLTSSGDSDQNAAKITLCDKDASDLCIVTFGAGTADDMTIIFQLPNANYTAFYVKASNKGVENTYSCEAASSPLNILCTGVRTPLGELLDVEVYSSENDLLIANGAFMVSSMAMSFSNSLGGFNPMGKMATPTATEQRLQTSFMSVSTATITPTPDAAYPNP